jgi:queuine tRNA-ribosyltransferase
VGGTHRGLTIESFETKLDGIRQALTQPNHFPQLARHFDATSTLLSAGHWRSEDGFIEWRLHPQSYLEAASAARPAQLIYWDFYSPKAVPDLWSERAFKTAYFSGRADAQLFTYSSSSRARVAMLLAGFFVGKGQATSTKSDTTVAAKSADDLQVPLTRSWLQNLRHSPHFDDQILQSLSDHPQFIISHCDVIRHVDAQ